MFEAPSSRFLVPFDGSFRAAAAATAPPKDSPGKKQAKKQLNRFLSRLDEPHKSWKFSAGDVGERGYWNDYQQAYEDALNATSRPWAPWYAIPADDKPCMRMGRDEGDRGRADRQPPGVGARSSPRQ